VAAKVDLIKAFYAGLPLDRAKVETSRFGFEFLEELLSGGGKLEYGELTLSNVLHKYKLTHIPAARMTELLAAHVEKSCNVCLYFGEHENRTFCFNLDNNHKLNNTLIIPELAVAVRALADRLEELGCEPLVVASGRGYHAWCRLEAAVTNARLHEFMLHAAAVALLAVHERGLDPLKVKFNFYPDPRINDVVSLRLFGSEHAKNKVFSHILTRAGLLDEQASWDFFEDYSQTKTIDLRVFERALVLLR
jgi:hypothetical protein